MEIKKSDQKSKAIKITAVEDGQVIGRASLCLIYNDLHPEPYGLLEDVFVEEKFRGNGLGTKLVEEVIEEAKKQSCHKLIANSRYSRPKVHELYEKIGFQDYGKEFRLDF